MTANKNKISTSATANRNLVGTTLASNKRVYLQLLIYIYIYIYIYAFCSVHDWSTKFLFAVADIFCLMQELSLLDFCLQLYVYFAGCKSCHF